MSTTAIRGGSRGSRFSLTLALCGVLLAAIVAATPARAATINKANNTTALNATGSWTGGVVPTASDIAAWTSTVTAANTVGIGGNLSWAGIQIVGPGGAVSITGTNTLTLGASGIDMNSATQNLTFAPAITLGAAQSWNVASGRTLTVSGNVSNGTNALTITGVGTTTLSGVLGNGSGTVTKDNTGTLTLSGTNTFTGALTVRNGLLIVPTVNNASASGPLGNSANSVTLGYTGSLTGTLRYTGGTATSTKKFSMGTGGTGSFEITNPAANLTLTGVIDGSGAMTKKGAGMLTLQGVNTFTGNVSLDNTAITGINVLNLQNSSALGLGAKTVTNAGYYAEIQLQNNITIDSGKTFILSNSGLGPYGTPQVLSTAVGAGTVSIRNVGGDNQILGNIDNTSGGGDVAILVDSGTLTLAGNYRVVANGPRGARLGGAANGFYTGAINDGTGLTNNVTVVTKIGTGTWTLSGNNTYTGATTVCEGALILDYTVNDTSKISASSPLVMAGGALQINGNTYGQTAGGLTLSAGDSSVYNASGATTLDLGAITRNAGGTVSFSRGVSAGDITTTSPNDASGILGGYATYGGTDWAAGSAAFPAALAAYPDTSYTTLSGAGPTIADNTTSNVRITSNSTGDVGQSAGVTTVNTLLVNDAAARTVAVGTGNTLRLGVTGGVLTPGASGGLTIGTPGSAGTLTAGGADDVAGELIFINNSASGVTVNSVIADNGLGAVSVTKSGAGLLTLSGANTYTGTTHIDRGTLAVSPGALPSGGGPIVFGGTSTLQMGGAAPFHSAKNLSLKETNTIDVTNTAWAVLGGTISEGSVGTGNLTKAGAGTLILTDVNPYLGKTAVTGGVLSLDLDANLGYVPNVPVVGEITLNGGSLRATNTFTLNANRGVFLGPAGASGTGTIEVADGNTLTVAGIVADNVGGTGGLIKTGAGTLVLSGINTFSGPVSVDAGILRAGNGAALGTATLGAMDGTTIASGATLDVGGQNLGNEQITVSGAGLAGIGALINTGGAQNNALKYVTLTGDATVGGVNRFDIRGGTLTANGYKLTKVAANYFSLVGLGDTGLGDIDLQNGTFSMETTSTLGAPDNTLTVGPPGILAFYAWTGGASGKNIVVNGGRVGSVSTGAGTGNTLNGTVALNVEGIFTLSSTTTLTVNSLIDGGRLLKTDLGTLALTNTSNSYSGGTYIYDGLVNFGGSSSTLGSGNVTLRGYANSRGGLQWGSGNLEDITASRTVTLGPGGGALDVGANPVTIEGVLSGPGSLVKAGTGTLTLANTNTYGGTTVITAGALAITSMDNVSSGVVALNGGALQILDSASPFTTARLVTPVANSTLQIDTTQGATLSNVVGTGGITRTGGGTLTLDGDTSIGQCFFQGGTTIIPAGASLTTSNKTVIGYGTGSAIVEFAGTGTWGNANNYVGVGDQSYTGQLVMTGGTLTVNAGTSQSFFIGNNNTGTVDLSGGTLVVGNNAPIRVGGLAGIANGHGILNISGTGKFTTGTTTGTFLLATNNATTSGTINLDGGVLETARAITGDTTAGATSTFNFNGGVFRALGTGTTLSTLTNAYVQSGGAIIDTGTFNISIGQALLAGTPSGGLTKLGTGTLTLNSAAPSTYTGDTEVRAGTLALNFANATTPTSPLIHGSSALKLYGASLTATAKSDAASTQTFNGATMYAGPSTVAATDTGAGLMTLDLGSVSRTAGATLSFTMPAAGSVKTTTTTANLLGWATVGTNDWAMNGAGSVMAFDSYFPLVVPTLPNDPTWNGRITSSTTGPIGQGVGTTTVNTVVASDATARTIMVGSGNTLRLGPVGGVLGASTSGGLTLGDPGAGAGTLTAGGADNTVGELVLINNSANPLMVNSAIANNGTGEVTLTKAGSGSVTLAGSSSYTGATYVNVGTLTVTSAAALAGTSGITVAATAQLALDGTAGDITISKPATITTSGYSTGAIKSMVGANTWAGDLTLGADMTRIGTNTGATLTVSGVIGSGSNDYGLAIRNEDATSPVILSGANTYLGDTHVVLGTLKIAGANNRLPTSTTLILGNTVSGGISTTFDLNGLNQEVAGVSTFPSTAVPMTVANTGPTASTLTINTPIASSSTYSGAISGNVSVVKTGAGTQVLSGTASDYAGKTTVSGGVLSAASLANGGLASSIGSSGSDAGNLVLDGGTLQHSGAASTTDRLFTVTSAGGTLDASGASNAAVVFSNTGALTLPGAADRTLTLTGNSTGANTLSATIGNPADGGTTSLLKSGAKSAQWVLAGTEANAFTGTTTVTGGKLILGKSAGTNAIGGNLVISTPNAHWSASGSGVELAASEQIPDTAILSFQGILSNDFSGFRPKGFTETVAGISCYNGSGVIENQGDGQTVTQPGLLILNAAADSFYNGYIRDVNAGVGTPQLALTKNGPGTLTFAGPNIKYSGLTTISEGMVVLDTLTTFTSGLAFSSGSTGIFRGGDNDVTLTALSTDATTPGTPIVENGSGVNRILTVNLAAGVSNTFAGTIQGGAGGGTLALIKTGAGSLLLAGNDTYAGGTTVTGGVLQFAGANSLPATGVIQVTSGGYVGANAAAGGFAGLLAKLNAAGSDGTVGLETDLAGGLDLSTFHPAMRLGSAGTGSLSGALVPQAGGHTYRFGGGGGVLTVASNLSDATDAPRSVDVGAGAGTSATLATGAVTLAGNNTYTGRTIVNSGALRLNTATALPATSNLWLNGGVFEVTPGSGDFTRTLGSDRGQVWLSNGGFSASGGQGNVNLGGSGGPVVWGSTYFTGTLVLGSPTADSTVDFQNSIDLNGAARTVRVDDGAADVDAIISGAVTNTGGTLVKAGAGKLVLSSGTNNFGGLQVNDPGTLELADGSSTTVTSVGISPAATGGVLNIRPGATLTVTGNFFLGEQNGRAGTVNQFGGTASCVQLKTGHWPNETSTYTIDDGSLTVTGTSATNPFASTVNEYNGALYIGVDGTGVFNHNGGLVSAEGMVLDNRGDTAGTDTYTMTGGTLTLGRWGIQGNASTQVNLGGGTVSASADWSTSRPLTLTGTGGSTKFDTAGKAISLYGAVSGAGGLTKDGLGTLTLASPTPNTYAGATQIKAGALKLGAGDPVPGAAYWLDASDPSTLVVDGANKVIAWNDKSGNFRDFAQNASGTGTVSYVPGALNGMGVVRFDGTDNHNLVLNSATAPETVFIVTKPSVYGTLNGVWGSNNPADKGIRLANATSWRNNDANDFINGTAGIMYINGVAGMSFGSLGTPHVVTARNGTSNNAYTVTTLGGYYAGRAYNGDIAEVLVYTTALSPGEAQAVEAYLIAKWLGTGSASNFIPDTSRVSVNRDATFDVAEYVETVGPLSDGTDGGGGISLGSLGGATLTVNSSDGANGVDSVFSGNITGAGALAKTGAGVLTLSGTNDYQGGTTVNAGSLKIAAVDALPAGRSLTIGAGGTLVLSSGLSAAAGGDHTTAAPVPEPGTLALLAVAALAAAVAWLRRK